MQKQVTYFENLVDSFKNTSDLEPQSPHFDLLKFEDIPNRLQEASGSPFRLNAFVVGLVTGGDFDLTISNVAYPMQENCLYFTSPWHIRQYAHVHNWQGYLLFFTPDFIFQYPQGEYIFREFRFFHTENGIMFRTNGDQRAQLHTSLDNMYRLLRSDHPEKMKMLFHYLNIFLYECKTMFASEVVPAATTKDTTLNNFLHSLNNYFIELNKGNMDKALTLKYVANEMHLHPTYLSNLLKQQTGKTAAQLVRERLILEAQSLLKNTDMTVAEVAYYLHFKDNSNFAKFFRHQVGQSPSDYREQAKRPQGS
ncbi:helix-turn-helix domain-containing protein [Flavihumibacter petaseus]|uniref:Putative AraC family transcriptional regulator n=1 Tax=Flavihumibacter petaseus NBRC 106054 TaxID=1220578 RepID=A0A0E9MX08_9BACT|nr:AraC family transcriptional regulator [Flavihumibacter petaseus]GAO42282.1 putative AraC family transcriptional regulator [Flavihumibacter petaseus NBRC 106054]